jgi:phenylacetate-CoA ligase
MRAASQYHEKIQGRTTDFIDSPDGRWQHGLSLVYVVRDIPGVEEFKIIQMRPDHVQVLIGTDLKQFPEDGMKCIVDGFRTRMGQKVNVTIEVVDEIPREDSGKFRYVVSRIAEEEVS